MEVRPVQRDPEHRLTLHHSGNEKEINTLRGKRCTYCATIHIIKRDGDIISDRKISKCSQRVHACLVLMTKRN